MHCKLQNNICRRFSVWNFSMWTEILQTFGYKRAMLWGSASHLQQLVDTCSIFLYHSNSTDCNPRSSLWEALPAPRKQPLRLPRYTLVTQTTSGGWQLLVSQKQRLAFICLFVTSVNGGRKSFWHLFSSVHQDFSEPSEKSTISGHIQAFQLMVLILKQVQLFCIPAQENDPFG